MKSLAIAAAAFMLLAPNTVQAAAHLLLESRIDAPLGTEIFGVDYATQADFVANTYSSAKFLPIDISSSFSIADIANENGAYHLLLESNADAPGGTELFLVDYASFTS